MIDYITGSGGFIEQISDQLGSILDLGDGYTAKALAYAEEETKKMYSRRGGKTSAESGYDPNAESDWIKLDWDCHHGDAVDDIKEIAEVDGDISNITMKKAAGSDYAGKVSTLSYTKGA